MRGRLQRLAVLAAIVVALAAVVPSRADETSENRELLDGIRDELVQMRFDEALSAIEAFLGRPGLSEAERGDALVLRAQAHAAFGDFDAVEQDYRAILTLRPGYEPDASLTPAKAMQRFEKVRAELVGRIQLRLDPPDAKVYLDGVPVVPDASGVLRVLAGSHTVRAERHGCDPAEQAVDVAANGEVAVDLELVPNARSVVLRTDQDGVAVTVDGEPAGVTSGGRPGGTAAELTIEDLPLGEHVYELSKPCFRTERFSDTLAVDLLDRSPKRYRLVRMAPVRSELTLQGGPSGAQVSIDGKAVARLPAETIEACPGSRTISVSLRERVVWQVTVELPEARSSTFDVVPRPNVVLVGTDVWPAPLADFGASFNTVGHLEAREGSDWSSAESWSRLRIPAEVDLALAVVEATRPGAADRWYLYSPILRELAEIETAPTLGERPRWTTIAWGFTVIDTRSEGPLRVVRVLGAAEAAGLAPGDRLVEVAGRSVTGAQQVGATLREIRADKPVRLKWLRPDGQAVEAELSGRTSPLVVPREERPDTAIVRAAWAAVDAAVGDGEVVPSALANLGLVFLEHGQYQLAVDLWRRVSWGERAGIGEGTKQYYLGRALEGAGREAEAVEAYRKAAASRSTAFSDEGPAIAPAARDRLADLGVADF